MVQKIAKNFNPLGMAQQHHQGRSDGGYIGIYTPKNQ